MIVNTRNINGRNGDFIVSHVEKMRRMNSLDEREYCIECGHYYNSNSNGEVLNCVCECHE